MKIMIKNDVNEWIMRWKVRERVAAGGCRPDSSRDGPSRGAGRRNPLRWRHRTSEAYPRAANSNHHSH